MDDGGQVLLLLERGLEGSQHEAAFSDLFPPGGLGLSPQAVVGRLLAASAVFGGVAVLLARLPKQATLSVTAALGLAVLLALARLTYLERRARNGG